MMRDNTLKGILPKERRQIFMRKLLALFIIFLTCLKNPVFASKVISPSCVAPSQISAPSKLTPIKKFEIFTPETPKNRFQAYLPPLPSILTKARPKVKRKTPQVQAQNDILLKPTAEPAQEVDFPIKIGTSADDTIYKKISLPEAIDYAMTNNLKIKSTRLETDKSRNDIKTAGRLLNPRIESFLNLGDAATDNPDYVGLIFPIELFKRSPRKKLARSTLELTKGNVALAEFNLRLDVRQAYVDLVAAKSMLKILDEQRQLLQELLNIAQRKYEVGAVPQMDVIHTKITLNQLLIQVNSARTNVLIARYKFNLLLQSREFDAQEDYLPQQNKFLDMLTPNSIEKMPAFESICNIALLKRLDIKNAKQDIDVAQKNLVTVIRKRVPDIELGAGGLYVPSGLSTDGTATTGILVVANVLNIPLLYQYSPEIKNAKIQVEQKELIYNNTKHVALMNLHSAYEAFIAAQANLNYYNDIILSESNQFLNMAKKSYVAGKSSMTDLIYIEQSYKNIIMGYINALANYYNSWVEVIREVNDEELKLNG